MYGAYVRWGMMCLWVGCAVFAGSLQPLQAAPDQSAKSAATNEVAGQGKKQTLNWGEIRIKGSYPEGPSSPGLLGDVVETLPDILKRFEKAGQDDDLNGLILRIESPKIGWAKLAEMRQAIGRVRAKGKRVIAWMEGGSSIDYLLACSCDEVAMPESGTLMLLGVRAEVTFFKNLFDKLDIKPDVLRIGEYKSAAEPFTRTEMSDAFREEMQAILDDYFDQIVTITAENRHLDRKDVETAIDSGPHTARAALQLKLIDRLAYEDELQSEIQRAHPDATFKLTRKYGRKNIDTDFSGFAGMVKMMNLLMGVESKSGGGLLPKIAVINATGMIATGSSESDLFGSSTLGSHTIVKAIREARQDSRVKAIVLRVDSPGGSALASDLMWREFEQIEQPFIASMGDVAASGGYYISMGADRIFAQPGTLTGSIGVVGGKLGIGGLFKKIGVTTSVISRGKNSGAMSTLTGFSDSEREAMMEIFRDIYAQFTEKAAAGRKMPLDKLEALARGRVYTGKMALEVGLVDELGSLSDAIAYAKQQAGLKPEHQIEIWNLPKPTSPFEALFGPVDATASAKSNAMKNAWGSLVDGLPAEFGSLWQQAILIDTLSRELKLTVLPYHISIR